MRQREPDKSRSVLFHALRRNKITRIVAKTKALKAQGFENKKSRRIGYKIKEIKAPFAWREITTTLVSTAGAETHPIMQRRFASSLLHEDDDESKPDPRLHYRSSRWSERIHTHMAHSVSTRPTCVSRAHSLQGRTTMGSEGDWTSNRQRSPVQRWRSCTPGSYLTFSTQPRRRLEFAQLNWLAAIYHLCHELLLKALRESFFLALYCRFSRLLGWGYFSTRTRRQTDLTKWIQNYSAPKRSSSRVPLWSDTVKSGGDFNFW